MTAWEVESRKHHCRSKIHHISIAEEHVAAAHCRRTIPGTCNKLCATRQTGEGLKKEDAPSATNPHTPQWSATRSTGTYGEDDDCHVLQHLTVKHSMHMEELKDKAKKLELKSSAIIQDHVKRPYILVDAGEQEDWQQLPEIPSGNEILQVVPDSALPENPIPNHRDPGPKPWRDKAAYLSAQYKLLREDAIRPLKIACQEFMATPDLGDSHQTSIYTHVYIRGYTFSPAGAAAKIQFSTERLGKRIRWSQSKRLQQGTIVALSPHYDNFRSICKVAVVAARSLEDVQRDPPQVDIFWSGPEEADFDPIERYVMVESKSGYFEASRHMLLAFQKSMFERMPLSEYLVKVEGSVDVADFLKAQPLMNLETLQQRQDTNHVGGNFQDLTNTNVLENIPLLDGSPLDKCQMKAVMRILTKKVAIVQGPPGTGKTFVSVAAILVMLRNWKIGEPPIVVSAQTNHALDQLLHRIAVFDSNILRLGGRAKEDDEVIQSFTLYRRRQEARKYLSGQDSSRQNVTDKLKRLGDVMVKDIEKMNSQPRNEAKIFFEHGLITKSQFDSVSNDGWTRSEEDISDFQTWLETSQEPPPSTPPLGDRFDEDEDTEYEALDEQEMEARKARNDDDMEALKGRYHEYRRNFVGKYKTKRSLESQVPAILTQFPNLEDVPGDWRGAVYQYLKNEVSKKVRGEFREHLKLYCRIAEDLKVAQWEQNVRLVRNLNIKLIGCTTTGLSKYRGVIAALQPRTLLIEEAAETLEGTVLAGMFESLQQLILVGDHEQRQAHCNISSFAEAPYNLAISLFERLVENGVEFTMLNTQRRMTPQLSELLGGVYAGLKNHSSVHGRDDVPGMGGRNSYFFTHTWEESRDQSLSRYNVEEAEMVVNFFNYLVLNGVNPEKITVLTFYNGQRKKIVKCLKEKPSLKNGIVLNVFTVDSYQGEENEIILLSLVRSNEECNVGFLENKNRAVVALSRARCGLYIFGNLFTLLDNKKMESFRLWNFAKTTLYERNELMLDDFDGPNRDGGVLPLVCQKHRKEVLATRARDLDDRGGCDEMCAQAMSCGHQCRSKCHWSDHADMICKQDCRKRIQACRKDHTCVMMCFQRCECQCPDSELIQRPVPIMRPQTDASAARRMIFHGLGVSREAGFAHALEPTQRKAHSTALAHRRPSAFGHENSQVHNQYAPSPPVPPGPPVIRERFRPVVTSSTGRQLGPANITHCHSQTRLPLTPNAAAAVAAPLPKLTVAPTRAYRVAEPIVEVTTRNVPSGQLSRQASNAAPHGRSQLNHPSQLSSRPAFAPQAPQIASRPLLRLAGSMTNAAHPVAPILPIRGSQPKASFNSASTSTKPKQNTTLRRPSLPTTPMMKVFVNGLPLKFSEMQLRTLLEKHGNVMTPQMWRSREGGPIGSGTVIMMRADGERAIKDLDGKAFEIKILKVEEFQKESRETPLRGRLALTRIRGAKSLGNLTDRGRRPGRRPATREAHETKDEANSWSRNASVVAEAGAVPFIPEVPSALEPPPGVPSRPDLNQEILANRAWAFADGMETVADGTVVVTVIGESHRNWRPATAMAIMREVPELDEDLIDFESDKENEKEDDMLTFSTVAKVKVELKPRPATGAISLLDL